MVSLKIAKFKNLSEHDMLSIQPLRLGGTQEELRTVGVGASVGHGEDPGAHVLEGRVDLISEAVTGAARTGAERATALDHEVSDHAVKCEPVVVGFTLLATLGSKLFSPFG